MNGKKWSIAVLSLLLLMLFILGGLTALVDPFFHYHAPLEGLSYELLHTKQRYINDGIARHFDYDILLTGTSMTENFSASLCSELFGGRAVKLPYEGSSFREVDDANRRAIADNEDIRIIIRTLDYFTLQNSKDDLRYDPSIFPNYLYDNNIFNDVSYVLNKTVLFENTLHTLLRSLRGEEMTDFDAFSRMPDDYFEAFGHDWQMPAPAELQNPPADTIMAQAGENVIQNLRQIALDHPEIDFYYFFPPYSVVHWGSKLSSGWLLEHIELDRLATSLLVDLENVHIFSFNHRPDMICALQHYMDDGCHYDGYISDMILRSMAAGEDRLTAENYQQYFDDLTEFFLHTDFTAYLEQYN